MTDLLRSPLSAPAEENADLSDIDLLQRISVELIAEHDLAELYGKIVDAAVAITGSQFGTMQLLCPYGDPSGNGGKLQLLCHRGLPEEAIAFWQWVSPSALSSCTMALRFGQRAIIPDFEEWSEIAGTDDLMAFRRAGIRSAQTTPLLSRSGTLLGMISTHWTKPHRPSERDLRLLDILARQAADLLERTIAEEALRAREAELRDTCAALRAAEQQQDQVQIALRQLNETLEERVEARTRELAESESQLRHMQKMDAIGQLTGGVAHDFNNLLTIIRSSADLLSRRELTPEKRQKYVKAISDTADRAAKLTGQLLAFARRQALTPQVFEVGDKIGAISDMLRTVVGSRVSVDVTSLRSPCFVEVDASQFETAFVNMAVNARDAMNGEGRLVVEIDTFDGVLPMQGMTDPRGSFVRISVTDEGSGIALDQIDSIFEPFFTTKAVGKGTGLGLSQVYGFTKQSGGEIEVLSMLGQGSTFIMYLPQVEAPASSQGGDAEQGSWLAEGRILIVEDNEQVGEFASDLLRDLGYETLVANDAASAIAILETASERIDAVFSDVVMPGIDGVELGQRVRDRWPGVTVVLTSGYSHVLANNNQHGFGLLHKPYSVEELSLALSDAGVGKRAPSAFS